MTREIPLSCGKFALVDDEDYERLLSNKWSFNKGCGYAFRNGWNSKGTKRGPEYMQSYVLPMRDGYEIDHIDGNRLNNTRANLRYVTHAQNQMNRKKDANTTKCTSVYKGVSRFRNKWEACTKINGKKIFIGFHDNEVFAAHVYDSAVRRIFGEYCKTNFDGIDENAELEVNKRFKNLSFASKYKGVTWEPKMSKWRARKTIDHKQYFIGYYSSDIEAHKAIEGWRDTLEKETQTT